MNQPLACMPSDDDSNYDDRILASLRRIIRAVDLYSRQLSLRHSLTGPQLVCVRHLLRHGAMAPGVLARRISLSPATVTGIIDRLERRGLVTRERSRDDKRRVEIALTATGRLLGEQTPPPLHETFSRRLGELPVEEQEEIDRVLARIVSMMEPQEYAAVHYADAVPLAPFLETGVNGNPLVPPADDGDGNRVE